MTHTSTEQPEALRLADIVERLNVGVHSQAIAEEYSAAARELRHLHARVQELEAQTAHMTDLVELADYATKKLEAAQAQRVPLSDRKIRQIDAHSGLDAIEFARAIERAHGITQEKQG